MARFRIGRGIEANLPSALVDGNIYFTIDTHKFYVDHTDSNGTVVRSQTSSEYADKLRYVQNGITMEISPEVIQTEISSKENKATINALTLSASGWASNVYSFESMYPVATYNVEIEVNGDSCTSAQVAAWNAAQIVGSVSNNRLKAMGIVPTIDIPIIVRAVTK